jgi:hypothetical protein
VAHEFPKPYKSVCESLLLICLIKTPCSSKLRQHLKQVQFSQFETLASGWHCLFREGDRHFSTSFLKEFVERLYKTT